MRLGTSGWVKYGAHYDAENDGPHSKVCSTSAAQCASASEEQNLDKMGRRNHLCPAIVCGAGCERENCAKHE